MVALFSAFVGLVAVFAAAHPLLYKRIAQIIPNSTAKWEQACHAAGGVEEQCNPLSITAFTTLLAAAGPCEQQNAADGLVNLGKKLKSAEMISLAQIFAQQPRNSPNSVATPYCQQAPQNAELNGLFQCQFASSNQKVFAGNLALGDSGTIPFGRTEALNPLGSCLANPSGPVPDGQQLVDITTNPNAPTSASSSTPAAAASPAKCPAVTASTQAAASATTASKDRTAISSGFQLSNGEAAQKLNAKFATLAADSSCTAGEKACIGSAFAQCVNGQFVTQSCSATLTCAALPLVNSAGTSITCTTTADAEARIAATGAIGGLNGSGAASSSAAPKDDRVAAAPASPSPPSTATTSSSSNFKLQNGRDAQALNAKFGTLTANSPCTAEENACVDGGFAKCVDGKFVVTQCAATLTCAALPLVNSAGTSITCTTQADALARIQATGATGGVTGS